MPNIWAGPSGRSGGSSPALPPAVQISGGIDPGKLGKPLRVSNGPRGSIRGGARAVTDLVLMPDGWVYGSTEAAWSGRACHVLKSDGRPEDGPLQDLRAPLRPAGPAILQFSAVPRRSSWEDLFPPRHLGSE